MAGENSCIMSFVVLEELCQLGLETGSMEFERHGRKGLTKNAIGCTAHILETKS